MAQVAAKNSKRAGKFRVQLSEVSNTPNDPSALAPAPAHAKPTSKATKTKTTARKAVKGTVYDYCLYENEESMLII